MKYKLNNVPISTHGATASPSGEYYALRGMLDLPRRTGKTEHDWGTSIEAFVQPEDIELDGRTLTLDVAVRRSDLQVFKGACLQTDELSIGVDTFSVVCKDEITVEEIGDYCKLSVPFWQNDMVLKPLVITASSSGVFQIDKYDLQRDFGIIISKSENIHNTAKRIDVPTTDYYTNPYHRGVWDIALNCTIKGDGFSDVYSKMTQFHSLIMSPGVHTLSVRNNAYKVYFKDGLTARSLTDSVFKFTLKIRGIGLVEVFYLLATEDGGLITTEDGDLFIDLQY